MTLAKRAPQKVSTDLDTLHKTRFAVINSYKAAVDRLVNLSRTYAERESATLKT